MTTAPPSNSGLISRRHILAVPAAAALAGLGPTPARAEGATLRVRIGSDIGNLDPARIFQIENQTVAGQVFSGLLKYDQKTNKIVPDIATSWAVSDDGLTYTFKLRQGVTFHKNYGPFTSDDVKFSFDRILDPAAASSYAGQFADVQSVAAPDPDTVVITLKGRNSGFPHKVTAFNQGWLLSRKAVGEIGADKIALNPIGTGPFVFEKWTPGSEVRLSANPSYFGGAPKIDVLLFKLIKDETAAAIALENNEIDIFFALQQPEIIARLRQAKGITLMDRDANHTLNLMLNMTIKPLDDLRVRQAIMYAVNRKAIIDGFFKGTKGTAYNVLTPSFVEYTEDVPVYGFDRAKAAALLKEAGAEGFTLDLVAPGLAPYDKIVVPIAADISAVGIKPNIKVLDRGAYGQARSKGEIMTALTAVVGPPDPDTPILTLFARKSWPPGLNTSHYAGVEDLLPKVGPAQTEADRKAIYKQILAKSMTDLPLVPLYADHLFMAHTANVQGLVQNSLFTVDCSTVSLKA